MSLREIDRLHDAIKAIEKGEQSAGSEREKARLQFDLRVLQAKREVVVASRARLLFDAFWKSGSMRVRHPYGQTLDYDGAPHHVDDIQRVWNARGQADTMAEWSEP